MKRCPQCNSIFNDDLSFCLVDGEALFELAEPETVVAPRNAGYVSSPPAVKRGVSPVFAYLTIGLLTILIGGGGAVALILWKVAPETSDAKVEITLPVGGQTKAAETPVQNQKAEVPQLTDEDVRALLGNWEKSQDTRDFALYKSCYDASFNGVKRTVSGSISKYDYQQWLSDRQKMMAKAKYMNVRLDKLQISIQDGVGYVNFDQYFSITGYADFGPKIMKVKMTETGAKIFFEELKSSALVT